MTNTATARTLLNPIEDMLGYQMRGASLATTSALSDAFDSVGLTMTEAMILRLVLANPGCNQAEIGRALGVKRTNMVPIIAGLVDRGLISRGVADGRTHALYITEEGARLRAEIARLALENEAHFFGDFDEPTRAILLQAFRSIRAKAAP